MKSLLDYISSNPMVAMGIAFLALLTVYFIFKQLIKIALFFLLLALAVGGYYYFKDPAKMPENIHQTLKDTREKSEKILKTGKQAYQTGKDIYEKSKDVYKKGEQMTKEARDFLKKEEEAPEKGP